MKNLIITESEKNRILGMHKSRSSRHYLMEQGTPNPIEKPTNNSPIDNKTVDQKANDVDEVTNLQNKIINKVISMVNSANKSVQGGTIFDKYTKENYKKKSDESVQELNNLLNLDYNQRGRKPGSMWWINLASILKGSNIKANNFNGIYNLEKTKNSKTCISEIGAVLSSYQGAFGTDRDLMKSDRFNNGVYYKQLIEIDSCLEKSNLTIYN